MNDHMFSETDLKDINNHGLAPETVRKQLRLFAAGVTTPSLIAPCTLDNGVITFDAPAMERLAGIFAPVAAAGRVTKFVPASGAATRMFKKLIGALHNADKQDPAGDETVTRLTENIDRLACYPELTEVMAKDGLNCRELIAAGNQATVLEYLLTPKGLAYADLPKGLIPFHRYPDETAQASDVRTAFEEHLAEAAELFADKDNRCRVHFTVPIKHEKAVREHVRTAVAHVREQYGIVSEVTFSTQHPATDTIAAAEDDTPFRDRDNRLVFRPGGHGALLKNLEDLQGDIVFIKNIDNIAVEPVRRKTAPALAALCGLLVELQQRLFSALQRLEAGDTDLAFLKDTAAWAGQNLNLPINDALFDNGPDQAAKSLQARLNRPLRVCGVVKNVGEPGGGPFWVQDHQGEVSVQIVEAAQVDMSDERQKDIWMSSTHFNPVIIACGVRDFTGQPFALNAFSDPRAGIITEKSKDGQNLKALEHPGLWNGAMAFWNTVFVELPQEAFNPVKTLFDLLGSGHRQKAENA